MYVKLLTVAVAKGKRLVVANTLLGACYKCKPLCMEIQEIEILIFQHGANTSSKIQGHFTLIRCFYSSLCPYRPLEKDW